MKRLTLLFLILTLIFLLSLSSVAAPDYTPVQISGDLISTGSIRFVNVDTTTVGYFSFPADRYYRIESAYLGEYSIPFNYEGVFIEYQGVQYFNQVVFQLTTTSLLDAYDRGDTLFLTVSAPSYSSQDLDILYLSDDGFTLNNASFVSRVTYDELNPLGSQEVLVPYYVNYSDGRFMYTYRFDSAFFTKNFPGVQLTYNSTLIYEDGDPYIRLKFYDSNNSSLLYNDNVDVKVVYSLLGSAPIGSSDVPGSSPNDVNDSFFFLTYLSFLGSVPYSVISPALDIDIFGVNVLFVFNCLLSFLIIALVVFLIIKVVK